MHAWSCSYAILHLLPGLITPVIPLTRVVPSTSPKAVLQYTSTTTIATKEDATRTTTVTSEPSQLADPSQNGELYNTHTLTSALRPHHRTATSTIVKPLHGNVKQSYDNRDDDDSVKPRILHFEIETDDSSSETDYLLLLKTTQLPPSSLTTSTMAYPRPTGKYSIVTYNPRQYPSHEPRYYPDQRQNHYPVHGRFPQSSRHRIYNITTTQRPVWDKFDHEYVHRMTLRTTLPPMLYTPRRPIPYNTTSVLYPRPSKQVAYTRGTTPIKTTTTPVKLVTTPSTRLVTTLSTTVYDKKLFEDLWSDIAAPPVIVIKNDQQKGASLSTATSGHHLMSTTLTKVTVESTRKTKEEPMATSRSKISDVAFESETLRTTSASSVIKDRLQTSTIKVTDQSGGKLASDDYNIEEKHQIKSSNKWGKSPW